MVCAYCGGKTNVSNSRRQRKSNRTWRRRNCTACGATFTTVEALDSTSALMVRASTEGLRPFERDNLFISLYESLKHRSGALTEAGHLTDTVINMLMGMVENGTIDNRSIRLTAHTVLDRFDKAAAVHYKAYYG